ncbi:GNAT family N-acetyltransferase [Halocatena pleomorpha]|uniref:GNAT family N-acetyltransferase n=1 Tax=Halocatena pleomorpha TaxID=1785090 RepID=A0A3P3RKA5_9EURY|nr:GNAT family N-acetyltransferase [Halocatena pleomorpha]RRJ33815.1 GNAT family N-acetyltransferase [Halocatena pleomorpha]
MEFRTATPADAVAVQHVARKAWHAAHAPIVGANAVEDMLAEWYDRDSLETAIRKDDTTMIVAVEAEVIGFAQGGPSEDGPADAVVWRIYVHPDRWGDGAGTKLLNRLFEDLRARNCASAWLTVMAENNIALSFYRKHGFEINQERTVEHAGHEVEDRVLVREL